MLSRFQASYQRVEQSLERLTESIAAYNPSASAADDLVAADGVVNENLEQLIVHQSNHLRIQELRQIAESLDQTLRRTIQTIADTRKEILAIPSNCSSEGERRQVEVDELLAYAKFISKTTVPPTSQKKKDTSSVPIKREETDVHMTNGITTPPAGIGLNTSTQNVDVKTADIQAKADGDEDEPAFIPWPAQDVIQRGALADVQRLIESGRDPGSVLTADEQAQLDEERKAEDERARLAQEEAERRRMSMFDTSIRRSTTADVFNPDDL